MQCVLLCFQVLSLSIMLFQVLVICPLSSLNSIPFYNYTILFFIHSFVHGHMDWFQLWENVSKMWTFLYRSFHECVFISLGKISKSEIVGLCSKHILNFIRNQLFFKTLVPLYIPTSNTWACQLLHKFANNWNGIAILVGAWRYHTVLSFTFIWWPIHWTSYHVPFGEHYCEVSVQGFPYFNWIVGYFIYFYVVEALYTQTGMCSHAHTETSMCSHTHTHTHSPCSHVYVSAAVMVDVCQMYWEYFLQVCTLSIFLEVSLEKTI